MNSEKERVEEIIRKLDSEKAKSRTVGGMGYDPVSKSFKPLSEMDPDKAIPVTRADLGRAAAEDPAVSVVFPAERLEALGRRKGDFPLRFAAWDDGDVYTALPEENVPYGWPGTLRVSTAPGPVSVEDFGHPDDYVRLVMRMAAKSETGGGEGSPAPVKAYVRDGNRWREALLQPLPVRAELFSRHKGLLETGVLSSARVLIEGLGTVGGSVAVELAKCGVMHFRAMDHDRIEVHNIVRHAAPIGHVGRYKTKSVADLIREKNPYCEVQTYEAKVTEETAELVRGLIQASDIVVCGADSPQSRTIINRLCVEEKKPCIMAGLRRRAYGGQVLFIHPGESLCYECYVRMSPGDALDREIATAEQAEGIAYADRPVPIEPGLSTDIAPINTMVVKLVIQELLKGKSTTLRSLDEDLVAPLYLWLNRRDADSPFAALPPMAFEVSDMSILRWYGIPAKRDPECPVCGDFLSALAAREGVSVGAGDTDFFTGAGA